MNKIASLSINSSNSDGINKNCQEPGTVSELQMNSNILSNDNCPVASINCKASADNASTSNSEEQNLPSSNNSLSSWKQDYAVDNFKDECLQQLCTNALPPYHPGSPPTSLRSAGKSFNKHCCIDCGDTFAFKYSLNLHLKRRSVLIKFPCETCKSTHIFFNRCNLLSHIRNHADKNESADIRKAVISAIPLICLDAIRDDFVNTLDDELNAIKDNDILLPSELIECSLHELDETLSDKEQNETKNCAIIKLKCLDCNEEFDTAKERAEHLTNGDKFPDVATLCSKCGLLCPSKCWLKAHQRVHLQIRPYVCPECGESPDPHWANFLHHVNFKCFHNARSVGYKCPICKRVDPSNESLLKHMEIHTSIYAVCLECTRAYDSIRTFRGHNDIYHNGEEMHYTVMYICSSCVIAFVSHDQMLNHRSTHLKEQICVYVFNCVQCGKPLESKAMLIEHIKSTHPIIHKQNVQTELLLTKPETSITVSEKGMVECVLCNTLYHSFQDYNVHVSETHINHNQKCEYCNKVLPNRKDMVNHGKLHLENKAIICLLCNNRKMYNYKKLNLHLEDHTKKLKSCSVCPVCDCLLENVPYAVNHLHEEHFLPLQAPGSPNKDESVSSCSSLAFDKDCNFCPSPFGQKEKTVPSEASTLSTSRKKNYDAELVCVPFSMGWIREHVIRATEKDVNKKRQSDVYYVAPDRTKLRSLLEIGRYLSTHPNITLTLKNFTFAKELIYQEPFETERDARQKVKKAVTTKKKTSPKSSENAVNMKVGAKGNFISQTSSDSKKQNKSLVENILPPSHSKKKIFSKRKTSLSADAKFAPDKEKVHVKYPVIKCEKLEKEKFEKNNKIKVREDSVKYPVIKCEPSHSKKKIFNKRKTSLSADTKFASDKEKVHVKYPVIKCEKLEKEKI